MVKFRCKCGQKIGVPESYRGHLVRCPRCAKAIPVPDVIDVPVVALEPPVQSADPDERFSFHIRPEAMAGLGVEIGGEPPAPEAPNPFGETQFSSVEVDMPGFQSDDPGLSLTGLASMIDEPSDSLALEAGTEHFEEATHAHEAADDGRALEDLIDAGPAEQDAHPGSQEQVTDLLRDLSGGVAEAGLIPEVSLYEPASSPVAMPPPRATESRSFITPLVGTVSLLVALGTLALCGLPHLARYAVPAGATGLVLAIGAMLAAGRRNGLGPALAGGMLSIVGVGLAVAIALGIAPSIDLTHGGAVQFGRAAMFTAPVYPTARAGDVEVRVTSAKVVRPVIFAGHWSKLQTLDRPLLQITFALKNVARRQRIEYRPWGAAAGSENGPALSDNNGDPLKMVSVAPLIPVGRPTDASVPLEPGKKGKADVLLFEEPPAAAQDLELQLPGTNVGAPGQTLRIQIPATMIKR